MIRRFLILVCGGCAILALPATGLAASDNYSAGFYTRGVDTAFYMDQGGEILDPFYIPAKKVSLLPRLSLSVTHEDNVFLDSENQVEGTSASLIPGMLAIWGRPTGNYLSADYGIIVPIYESVQALNDKPSHLLRLGGIYRTGKSQIQASLGYRILEDVDTVVGARVAKQDVLADVNTEYRVSGKSSLGLLGHFEKHNFDLDRYSNYMRYYGAGRIYHRISAKSEAFLQGSIGRDDPEEEEDQASAADFYDLSLGVRGKQSPKFNILGRAGYMWRQYDEENREDLGHWIASLQASSTPFGLSTFTGELYADVRPAIDSAGTDVIDQGGVLTVSRRLFINRFRGNASLMGGVVDYSGGPSSGSEADGFSSLDGRRDDYWGFSLGLDWYTRKNFSIGLDYSYMQRDGDQGGNAAAQEVASYEYGRWTLRASWNY